MESGLEDRNNDAGGLCLPCVGDVSMESGLEDRNNHRERVGRFHTARGLNGVRPRRPEQWRSTTLSSAPLLPGLNGVRPRRPEQCHVNGMSAAQM